MEASLLRSIVSLVATPQKRRAPAGAELATPAKAPRLDGRCCGRAVAGPPKPPPQEAEQVEVLCKLFAGLDTVLMHFTLRGRRAWLSAVRVDVEAATGRSFTDERMMQLLAAADGMLEVVWGDADGSFKLEVLQRGDGGRALEPSTLTLAKRRERFAVSVAKAMASGTSPTAQLPSAPTPSGPEQPTRLGGPAAAGATAYAPVPDAVVVGTGASEPSGASRLDALRGRVMVRQGLEQSVADRKRALAELGGRIGACEAALLAHAVVEFLLAREEGGCAASEAEAVAVLSSRSSGMQCKRPLEPEAARAAVATLVANSGGWLVVEQARLSRTAGYFMRRAPGASSAAAKEALDLQLVRLHRARTALARGAASTEKSADNSAAPAATPSCATAVRGLQARRRVCAKRTPVQ